MSLIVAAILMLAPQTATVAPAKPVKEKQVCRREQNSTSRMAAQTCRTRAEWATIDSGRSADADRLANDSRLSDPR